MKENKFVNEDLKSLQDLQEKYQMKEEDILDRMDAALAPPLTAEEFRNLPKE